MKKGDRITGTWTANNVVHVAIHSRDDKKKNFHKKNNIFVHVNFNLLLMQHDTRLTTQTWSGGISSVL